MTSTRRERVSTRVRRLPELAHYDRRVIHDVLDSATHCHIAHLIDGRPVATPTLHWRIGERVYWHGSVASRMLKATSVGAEVCLTATIIDGWVLARSAFNHSANYRSVMCFGEPEPVVDTAEKTRLLEVFTERLFPGRWARLRPVSRKELGATRLLSLPLDSASAKVRVGPPDDPARDRDWPVWAGVIPIVQRNGAPVPDQGLPPGLPGLPRVVRRRGQAR
jgi:nitroimidazol reductase NimA-like FMN-containing flavoprotein (pyridoxamine 5'-phosphate oxidase superfamily)